MIGWKYMKTRCPENLPLYYNRFQFFYAQHATIIKVGNSKQPAGFMTMYIISPIQVLQLFVKSSFKHVWKGNSELLWVLIFKSSIQVVLAA